MSLYSKLEAVRASKNFIEDALKEAERNNLQEFFKKLKGAQKSLNGIIGELESPVWKHNFE